MSSDYDFVSLVSDTVWRVLDALNTLEVFEIGLVSWFLIFLVASMIISLLRALIWGRDGGQKE